jgi:uncharacterized surface protein with fasciclin (FAS1) repeats
MNCHDRNPVRRNEMSNTTESEKNASAPEAPQPKTERARNAKPPKKAARAKKPASKPTAERSNKRAEVIALMKRAKGATLAEIMAATKWQAHTVRGFVSILGSKGGEKIESSKNAAGERTYKIGK